MSAFRFRLLLPLLAFALACGGSSTSSGTPGTPAPAPADPNPLPIGGNGSKRFEMGVNLQTGLYLVDPVAGEASVTGLVAVTLGDLITPAPTDAVVTMNGVPLTRVPPPSDGRLWALAPAPAPQPKVGSGGQLVLVATATDPTTGQQIQRSLVLPCPSDVQVATTPASGAALVPSTTLHLASASSVTLNDTSPGHLVFLAQDNPKATLWGYEPSNRALVPYGSAVGINPGPLSVDVPVCEGATTGSCSATTGSAYLLDLRWEGTWVPDGQSGGFCGLAKRVVFAK
jgi:hypothetical protein